MYYHAVCILSCRPKLSDGINGLEPSYVRQGLAAIRINSIVASECSQGLPPLPIVPYALSLSTGVSYQQFRSSKLITHFDRAKSSLQDCCSLLEGLAVYWYSAEAMARLGRKALQHMEEVRPDTRGRSEKQISPGRASSVTTNPVVSAPAPTVPRPSNLQSHGWNPSNEEASRDNSSTCPTQDPPTLGSWEPHAGETEALENDSFADIDMLFGDFLDLSLPTNFWDPVFFHPGE